MRNTIIKIILVVLLIAVILVLGFLIYNRFISKPAFNLDTDTTLSPIPEAQTAKITFSLESSNESVDCVELNANPIQGSAPLKVTFSAAANGNVNEPIQFVISYGDVSPDEMKMSQNPTDGMYIEEFSHLYTASGNFQPSIIIKFNNQTITSEYCKISITVFSDSSKTNTLSPTIKSSSLISSTLSPTITTATRSITSTPVLTQNKTYVSPSLKVNRITPTESVPAPDVPRAGGVFPTIVAGIGVAALVIVTLLAL